MDLEGDKDDSHELMTAENAMTIGGSRVLATSGEKFFPSILVHSLVVILGISAWIGVNGIYVQLPLLVTSAPEGWNLAAHLVLVIQAANVGPTIYTLARKCSHPNESACIFVLLLAGSLSMGLLAFFHRTTYFLGNTEHSVTLFVCGFFAALVGCTSSVLFMPYLRNSSERYLVSYFIGEGLSGVLPSVAALLQGVGNGPECVISGNGTTVEIPPEPRFSSTHFFILIFAILALSFCTFGLLQYLLSSENSVAEDSPRIHGTGSPSLMVVDGQPETSDIDPRVETIKTGYGDNNVNNEGISVSRTVYLHVLVGLVCFLGNGFLPGVQTYSCLPYGKVAFHLTVTLANLANPTACLLYLWADSGNLRVLDALTFVGVASCTYAVYLAATSPDPPLRDSALGVVFTVLTWVLLTGIISYLKLFVTSNLRRKLGPNALLGVGIVMQLGSACGALISFGLVNYAELFRQDKTCAPL